MGTTGTKETKGTKAGYNFHERTKHLPIRPVDPVQRGVAALVDLFALSAATLVVWLLPLGLPLVEDGWVWLVFAGYQFACLVCTGTTLGKWVGGARVVDKETGQRLSVRQAALRCALLACPSVAGSASYVVFLLLALPAFKTGHALHDQLSDTVVTSTR